MKKFIILFAVIVMSCVTVFAQKTVYVNVDSERVTSVYDGNTHVSGTPINDVTKLSVVDIKNDDGTMIISPREIVSVPVAFGSATLKKDGTVQYVGITKKKSEFKRTYSEILPYVKKDETIQVVFYKQ